MITSQEEETERLESQIELLIRDREMNLERIRKMEIEIKELMNAVSVERTDKKRKERELKMEIKAIEMQMEKLELENSALREQLRMPTEVPKSAVEEFEELSEEEMERKRVLQNFHPDKWPFLEDLAIRRPLTIDLLNALVEKQEIKLVILAMSLMTDHNVCLEILKELAEKNIVKIEYKREGDLNPLIKLKFA